MSEYLMYNLTEYLMLTLVFFIITLLISITIYSSTKKIDIHKKTTRYFGLISALKNKQVAMLCSVLIRLTLILYSILVYQEDILISIIMILIADLIFIVLKSSVFEFVNIGAQVFLIYFINVLQEYRIEVADLNYIFLIQLILTSFLILYVLYFAVKNFSEIIMYRKIEELKKIEKEQKKQLKK